MRLEVNVQLPSRVTQLGTGLTEMKVKNLETSPSVLGPHTEVKMDGTAR